MIKRLIRKCISRVNRRTFIPNLTGGISDLRFRALLYYKNEPYWAPWIAKEYAHANNWEILELQRILNSLGFVVDALDRNCQSFVPEDHYHLFFGLGAGNSGRHYARLAGRLPRARKVMLAMGPAPDISNELVLARYNSFRQRTGHEAPPMRTVDNVMGQHFQEVLLHTDYICTIGEPHVFSPQTYAAFGKPILTFMPGISSEIHFSPYWLNTRKRSSYLCFAGNGFICKGVDLLVEAFATMPDKELIICGPDTEPAFFEVYGRLLRESPNIRYEGFVSVGSAKFNEICSRCAFVIFHSSSEGCATSVATCLRAGLVPLLSYTTSIDVRDFGCLLPDGPGCIENIREAVAWASSLSDEDYRTRALRMLADSVRYSQGSYTSTMMGNLIRIIEENPSIFLSAI